MLGALDASYRATDKGKRMASAQFSSLDPSLAAMVIDASTPESMYLAITLAAVLSCGDSYHRFGVDDDKVQIYKDLRTYNVPESDHLTRVNIFLAWCDYRDYGTESAWINRFGLNPAAMRVSWFRHYELTAEH